MRVERSQAAPVEVLLIGISAGQGEIDVVEHSGIACAGLARSAGHQPLGESRDRGRIVIIEERAMAAGMRVRLRRAGGRVGRRVMLPGLRQGVGYEARPRDGARANRRADQECTAGFVMFVHADASLRFELVLFLTGRMRRAEWVGN